MSFWKESKEESLKAIKIHVTCKWVSLFLSDIWLKLHLKTGPWTTFSSLVSASPPHVGKQTREWILFNLQLRILILHKVTVVLGSQYILSNWMKHEDATMHQRKATNCFVSRSGWAQAGLAPDYYWPILLGLQHGWALFAAPGLVVNSALKL